VLRRTCSVLIAISSHPGPDWRARAQFRSLFWGPKPVCGSSRCGRDGRVAGLNRDYAHVSI